MIRNNESLRGYSELIFWVDLFSFFLYFLDFVNKKATASFELILYSSLLEKGI